MTTANDGTEAVVHLRRDPAIVAVLTDVVMTSMDGRQLAQWIGTNRPEVGVVL